MTWNLVFSLSKSSFSEAFILFIQYTKASYTLFKTLRSCSNLLESSFEITFSTVSQTIISKFRVLRLVPPSNDAAIRGLAPAWKFEFQHVHTRIRTPPTCPSSLEGQAGKLYTVFLAYNFCRPVSGWPGLFGSKSPYNPRSVDVYSVTYGIISWLAIDPFAVLDNN